MIAVQQGGTSNLGEVWISEAPSITGPWRWAQKIVTHDKYTFYNPVHHPFLDALSWRHAHTEDPQVFLRAELSDEGADLAAPHVYGGQDVISHLVIASSTLTGGPDGHESAGQGRDQPWPRGRCLPLPSARRLAYGSRFGCPP